MFENSIASVIEENTIAFALASDCSAMEFLDNFANCSFTHVSTSLV